MSPTPILPQQARENPEPTERHRPMPWGMLLLVGLMATAGLAYIAHDATDAPAAQGDQRAATELRARPSAAAAAAIDGAALYAARCTACHQATGAGVAGAFPPLAGSEWVTGSERRLVALVLHGVNGPLTVRGQAYDGAMPAFGAQLGDGELAAVLTHVRQRFGPDAAAVSRDTVAQVRQATQGRTAPFAGEAALKELP